MATQERNKMTELGTPLVIIGVVLLAVLLSFVFYKSNGGTVNGHTAGNDKACCSPAAAAHAVKEGKCCKMGAKATAVSAEGKEDCCMKGAMSTSEAAEECHGEEAKAAAGKKCCKMKAEARETVLH